MGLAHAAEEIKIEREEKGEAMTAYMDSWGGTWSTHLPGPIPVQPGAVVISGGPGGVYSGSPYPGSVLTPVPTTLTTTVNPVTGQTQTTSSVGGQVDPTTGLPTTGQAPAPSSSGFDLGSMLSGLTSMQIFGIPVIYIAGGLLLYFFFFKKGRR